MKRLILASVPVLLAAGALAGCSSNDKSLAVAGDIRKSLDGAGFKDVSVKQDRDKGVITLTGHVPTESEKAQAESIAKSEAGTQVVADEIAVVPPGAESEMKRVNSDLDKAIEKNVDAVLVEHGLHKNVSYDVKNGVVTLKGTSESQALRTQAEKVTAAVPNVQQVVNELQVEKQKATSTQ